MEDLGLLSPPMRRAWATVGTLLEAGRTGQAEHAAVIASGLTEWTRFPRPLQFGGPVLYRSEVIPLEWCWFEPDHRSGRCLITSSVMARFANTGCVDRLTNGLSRTMSEPGFRRYSIESWTALLPPSFRQA